MRRRRQQEERRMKMIMTAAAVICVLLLVVGVGILLRRRMPEVVHMTEDTGKTAVVVKKKEKTSEKQTENQTEDQKKEQSGTQTESRSTAQKKEGTETQINPENIQNQNTPAKKVQEQNASTAGNQNSGTVQVQQPENNSSASAEAETTAASNSSPEYTSAENLGLTLTDESVTLYSADGSAATYIYKATNGNWYDGSGRNYVYNGNGTWSGADGSSWSETAPAPAADKSGASVTVTDEDGLNSQTLYQDSSSGSWVNEAGGIYTDNGDGSFTGPDGNLWYS